MGLIGQIEEKGRKVGDALAKALDEQKLTGEQASELVERITSYIERCVFGDPSDFDEQFEEEIIDTVEVTKDFGDIQDNDTEEEPDFENWTTEQLDTLEDKTLSEDNE